MKKWIGLALLVGLTACGGGDSESDLQYEAKDSCHEWVKEKLKSPATAEFSGDSVTGTGGDYAIAGNVDSQNGFGAVVRTAWTCTVRLDGDTWRGSATVTGS